MMRDIGQDPLPLLRRAGLDAEAFANPDTFVPIARLGQFVALCAAAAGREDLGLQVALRAGPGYMGLVSSVASNSPDVRTALSALVKYFHHHDQAALVRLERRGGMVRLEYALQSGPPGADLIVDAAIAIGFLLLKSLAGPAWEASAILLTRPRPADEAPYRALFGPILRFGEETGAILFAQRWLDAPIPAAAPSLRLVVEQYLEDEEQRWSSGLSGRLRQILLTGLPAGELSIDAVAASLSMSRRTVSRRLKLEQTSFRRLVDATRCELAQRLLETTDNSVAEIARRLRYSEPGAFIRAFKRWSGTSPGEWRQGRA